MDIQERSLRSLEWDRLVLALANQSETPGGRARLLAIVPHPDLEDGTFVQLLLDQTSEALDMLGARACPSLAGLDTNQSTIELLSVGSTLGVHELLSLEKLLRVSRTVRASLVLLDKTSFPRISPFAQDFVNLPALERDLTDALDPDGTVKDEASPVLRRLRREARELSQRVKDELRRLINSLSGAKALQDDIYTVRNGRYVLPVNSNQRYQVDGIVHDASQSGLTVFVEPVSVMEISNQMRIKESEIEAEIERILLVLTETLRPHAEALALSLETATALDCVFARGRLARITGGERPELSNEPCIDLKNLKHPLLVLQSLDEGRKRAVIGNDVTISSAGKMRSLIITGPNTGGKTVLLKSIGFAALMTRCGLLPLAARGSRIALYRVSADIGDEQSIAENLSTFSSHIKNLVELIAGADENSLVLLDEVGAGTDPKEGAALSQALLEYLSARGASVIATTHLGELKTLAYTDESFVNGSFEFDMDNLSPTYRLRLGVPGSSRATEVATRLGLDAAIIERASTLAAASKNQLDQVVEALTEKLDRADELEAELKETRERLESQEGELKLKLDNLEKEKSAMLEAERAKLQYEYGSARDLIKETVADLQKQPGLKKAELARKQLEELRQELAWDRPKPKEKKPEELFAVGMKVRVQALNRLGEVHEVFRDSRGLIEGLTVQMGTLRLKVKPDELDLLKGGEARKEKRPRGRSYEHINFKSSVQEGTSVFVRSLANTLDIRGKRVEEAEGLIDTFVDGCVLNRVSPFMIIHGHGTGALKNYVRDFIAAGRYKLSQRSGETYEGGDGVTVIELKN